MSVSKEGVMKTFTIHVDFDGRREDGEYFDGRSVRARDEDEAWEKFNDGWIDLEHFGAGYWISSEEDSSGDQLTDNQWELLEKSSDEETV